MIRLRAVPIVKERTPREMSSMLRPLLDICGRDGKVYNGQVMSFEDKAHPPDDEALAKGLGAAKKPWDEFVRRVADAYPPVEEAWGFYKAWSLRLKHKKRTIVYLLPAKDISSAPSSSAARPPRRPGRESSRRRS